MFQCNYSSDLGSIGDRNVKAVKENLSSYAIPVIAEDVGKDYGRTIIFNPSTKKLVVRSAGKKDIVI